MKEKKINEDPAIQVYKKLYDLVNGSEEGSVFYMYLTDEEIQVILKSMKGVLK